MRELMREGVRRGVGVRFVVQQLVAHVEDDVVVRGRLRRCWPGVVPQIVALHHPGIRHAAFLHEDVYPVRASVHEGHGTHDLALVLHPTVAALGGLQLLQIILVGVNFGGLDGHVLVELRGTLFQPDVDVVGDDSLEREGVVPSDAGVLEDNGVADRRVLPHPAVATVGVAQHVGEPREAKVFAVGRLQIEAAIAVPRAVPDSLEEGRRVVGIQFPGRGLLLLPGKPLGALRDLPDGIVLWRSLLHHVPRRHEHAGRRR
mmetsp:Transcript_62977/g.182640  ORF Transcript_62977/g.182640 Transcript_62977/m.182640 type:complete len:259 (-) Transcript_62977:280-1056(-)